MGHNRRIDPGITTAQHGVRRPIAPGMGLILWNRLHTCTACISFRKMVCRDNSAGSITNSFYSYQSGDWDNSSTWTTDQSGTFWINPGVPGSIDNVTILNGRTISINTNGKQVTGVTIVSGGILDIKSTTGHNFGTVAGQGKIMLSSPTFPGGTYTGFLASNTGTFEYYNLNGVGLPCLLPCPAHIYITI